MRLHHACGRALALVLLGCACAAPARAQSAPPPEHTPSPVGGASSLAGDDVTVELHPGNDTFEIDFILDQNRTGESSVWTNLTSSRLDGKRGHPPGERSLQRGSDDVTIRRYVSGGGELGTDLRYQRGTMTSVVAVHPDFGIVDRAVAGIGPRYTEKHVADQRSFFRDGADFFGSGEVFYSGRIDTFDVGLKTFGRVDDYKVGMLVTTADGERTDYVGRVVREVGRAFHVSATVAGREQQTGHADALQFEAGGRIGSHLRVNADVARSDRDGDAPGARRRGEIAYHASHFYSGVWVDHTDPEYLPPIGILRGDPSGTSGRGTYAGYSRAFDSWTNHADVSVAYDNRDTLTGLPQRESVSVYASVATAAHVRLNTGVTSGVYRPRGRTPGEWMDALNDDRFYLASAFYESSGGRFGYGAQYSWGVAGAAEYDSVAPSVWVAPAPGLSGSYSFERATNGEVYHQHVLSGTWQITRDQSVAARWVEYEGGYYTVSYRRALARDVDAIGVYSSDPYERSSLDLKLIWSLRPLARN